jgi:AraC-like DNA-binding protein
MNAAYREFPASQRFRAHIECFWCQRLEKPVRDFRVLPDGCVDILFERSDNGIGGLSVIGTMTRPHSFDLPAKQSVLGARFRPAMVAKFLKLRGREFVDGRIALADVWNSRRVRMLAEQIAQANTPEQGAALTEAALGEAPPLDAVERAIARLVEGHGAVDLDGLASAAGLSGRQFRRVCLERTGVTPKRLARIVRFRRAMRFANSDGEGDWADVALQCGYYDQAHLINDFREFSGVAPGRFASGAGPI